MHKELLFFSHSIHSIYNNYQKSKGLKFENVSILIEKIRDLIGDNCYCWVDHKGFIFKQKYLFRVNCVDCLDRTNVIQMVIGKNALENQLGKIGILVPPVELPAEFKKKFLSIWANNGDAISQQYAGTSALKGDFTRTGERNLAGIMKDMKASASRYYLRFKDSYRQMAIDVLQGVKLSEEDMLNITGQSRPSQSNILSQAQDKKTDSMTATEEIFQTEREENVKQLVADCRKQLVDVKEDCYGSWALINYTE